MAALWLSAGTDASAIATMQSTVVKIRSWISGTNESVYTLSTQPSAVHSPVASQIPKQTTSSQHPASPQSRFDHASADLHVCSRPHTKVRSDTPSRLVYEWRDSNGQTHMSDNRPEGRIASVMNVGPKTRDFTYEIIEDGITLPDGFEGQLHAGSKRIYDTWHFFLGEAKLRQSEIQLRLIGGHRRFNAYHARLSPGSNPVSGFYRMSDNQAVVKFDPANLDRVMGTTFHEVSHLITASHLGPTPPWLTEGLAEYFETMQVGGQGRVIHPNAAHIALLKKSRMPSLTAFLSQDRGQWYGADRSRNYAVAWSLMHFLMKGPPGMYALRDLVRQAEENYCQTFSAVDALDNAYPGGIRRLEADWNQWFEL